MITIYNAEGEKLAEATRGNALKIARILYKLADEE